MRSVSAILAIVSALVFLGFSMYYDNVDTPESPLPSSYYFIPLWAMISGVFFALMFNVANNVYRAFFWFFFILSQLTIKSCYLSSIKIGQWSLP